MKGSTGRSMIAGLAVVAVLAMGAGTRAEADEEQGYWSQAGLGLGSMLSNVVYMPCKIAYATLGTITGGLTYALTGGSYETAENVWVASLGGTYVITPDMLTGKRAVEFSGTPQVRAASGVEEPAPLAESDRVAPPMEEGYARDSYY